jgi:hypothetical protein
MDATNGQSKAEERPLVCRVTGWYYRRMALAGGMCLVFGLYFLYDWKVGYPKANEIAAQQEWFEKELLPSYEAAKQAGRLEAWREEAAGKGWPTGKGGEAPKWVPYAAAKGWPEKPKRFTQKEIDEQWWWGMGTLAVAAVVGLAVLVSRNQTLSAGADSLLTPSGERIRFDQVHRVDKRKWDGKGLAYLWYRAEPSGKIKKTVIDDLKFGGAGEVLERVLKVFRGELIEKVAEEEALQEGENEGEMQK